MEIGHPRVQMQKVQRQSLQILGHCNGHRRFRRPQRQAQNKKHTFPLLPRAQESPTISNFFGQSKILPLNLMVFVSRLVPQKPRTQDDQWIWGNYTDAIIYSSYYMTQFQIPQYMNRRMNLTMNPKLMLDNPMMKKVQVMRIKHARHEYYKKSDTEFEVFCKCIAVHLKKMPVRNALRIQLFIQNLMTNERLEQMPKESDVIWLHLPYLVVNMYIFCKYTIFYLLKWLFLTILNPNRISILVLQILLLTIDISESNRRNDYNFLCVVRTVKENNFWSLSILT